MPASDREHCSGLITRELRVHELRVPSLSPDALLVSSEQWEHVFIRGGEIQYKLNPPVNETRRLLVLAVPEPAKQNDKAQNRDAHHGSIQE
jgi:hypothetical protein